MSEEFELERTLGEGAFGKVYLVNATDTKQKYAMKVIDLRTSPQEEKELAVKESQLLKQLSHQHILSYTDSFENDGALCIVTEYCANGDLSEYLEKRGKRKLEEDRLKEWFKQMASALQYLHSKEIIHRDVKTPNIFLTHDWNTKLGDLGLAKVLDRPNAKAVTFCGSPYYMSPEIFSCKPYDSKSDIWALGVIVYEMATLERPFDAMLMHQLVFKIVHGGLPTMPAGYDGELTQVLSSIMQKDPVKRPSASDLLNHQYFKGAKKPEPLQIKSPRGAAGAKQASRWDSVIKRGQSDKPGAGPFNIDVLLSSLSVARKADREKREAQQRVVGGDDTLKGIETIMAKTHLTPNTKDKASKTVKSPITKGATPSPTKPKVLPKPSPKPSPQAAGGAAGGAARGAVGGAVGGPVEQASLSDVHVAMGSQEDFDKTLKAMQSEVAGEAFHVMQLIVRTLTGVIGKDKAEGEAAFQRTADPEGMMLRQIEHLQHYCGHVLVDELLLTAAYDILGQEKDEIILEKRLIELLGHEKFEKCGVQLLFLKNYEYNYEKLRSARKH